MGVNDDFGPRRTNRPHASPNYGYPIVGDNGIRGTTLHNGVHYEAAGDHSGKGGILPHFWTLRWGGADARDMLDDKMVGPWRGKWTWGLDRVSM